MLTVEELIVEVATASRAEVVVLVVVPVVRVVAVML